MESAKKVFTLSTLFVITLSFILLNFNIVAKEEKTETTYVRIDSITADHAKFITNKKITFKGTFLDPADMDIYSIAWDFGDGNIATGTLTTASDVYANPGRCSPYKNECFSTIIASNVYKISGDYTIIFSVKNSKGNLYTDSEEIIVSENSGN